MADAARSHTPLGLSSPEHNVRQGSSARTTTVRDHTNRNVSLAWLERRTGIRTEDSTSASPRLESDCDVPPFPFPVYILSGAPKTAADDAFPAAFAEYFETKRARNGDQYLKNARFRFDVYSVVFDNFLACIEHQDAEVRWRNTNNIWPRLVENWTQAWLPGEHDDFLVAIDTDEWRTEGIVTVRHNMFNRYYRGPRTPTAVVAARKQSDTDYMPSELNAAWSIAGGVGTEQCLENYNRETYSADDRNDYSAAQEDHVPAPPAAGSLDSVAAWVTESSTTSSVLASEDETTSPSSAALTADEMWSFVERSDDRTKSMFYEDSMGSVTESAWSEKHGSLRPAMSITLYCDRIVLPTTSLFRCLNRGLIASMPWTLDVKRGFSDLEPTLEYHRRESIRRTTGLTKRRRSVMQMVVHRVAGPKLPVELLDVILEILVPPPIPNYLYLPEQGQEHLFLYLGAESKSSILRGPLIVNWFGKLTPALREAQERSIFHDVLRVTDLRNWDRVENCLLELCRANDGIGVEDWDPTPRLNNPLESTYTWGSNSEKIPNDEWDSD